MDARLKSMLDELRAGLDKLYGDSLDRVILFGSRARGDAGLESDVDILVVLKGPFNRRVEMDRTDELFTTLALRHGLAISRVIRADVDIDPSRIFYANVLREGVRL